jgi:hypothetical protein
VVEDEPTRKRFVEVMSHFALVHKQPTPSPALLRAYFEDLKEMSMPDFERAQAVLRRTAQWFPKPAEFIRAARTGWT